MATSTAIPAGCPACGYMFTIADVPTQQAHYLAHMMVNVTKDAMATVDGGRVPSNDW